MVGMRVHVRHARGNKEAGPQPFNEADDKDRSEPCGDGKDETARNGNGKTKADEGDPPEPAGEIRRAGRVMANAPRKYAA
ncbi:MAG: hypothetical protein MZV63_46035 [Marinilabiliales bacterium]|nr:hypothetical protein [Marinilabiliales bacterium]